MRTIRNRIINLVKDTFIHDDRVYALWLEGSDGLGRTDEYSDIDIWLDAADGKEEEVLDLCTGALRTISEPDFIEDCQHPHPKIFQRNMHLKDTSEYLLIDICVQSHSRGAEGCTFVKGDRVEFPRILFDKGKVIHIIAPPRPDMESMSRTYKKCRTAYLQRSRLTKYLLRNQYLEAYAYFDKYVRQPLICLYRLIYTPRHSDYMLVHISSHFPEELVGKLEKLYKVGSVADIRNILPAADALYESGIEEIHKQYGFQ